MSIKPRFGFVLEHVSDVETAKEFYVASDQPLGSTGEHEVYWVIDDA